jgi:hypothetical protein
MLVQLGHLRFVQQGQQLAVDVAHQREHGAVQRRAGRRQRQHGLAPVARLGLAVHQPLGHQRCDGAGGARTVQLRALGQLRRQQATLMGQLGQHAPFAPGDAKAALAQADDHAAGHAQQAVGAVQQQVVQRAGVGKAVGGKCHQGLPRQ